MSKYQKWLLEEIPLWVNKGIIDDTQASEISALYASREDSSWGKVIFAALGSIIFGLGVILLFAYNWEAMHRFSKLFTIFFAIAIAHGLGYYFSAEHSSHKKIGESLHLLGTMLFGAGIWLVAQIYHIDEHFPNALLVWALGALAFAWVIPSKAHTILAMGLISLWHGFEVFKFGSANHTAVWIILLGVIPLTWIQRARGSLFLGLALFLFAYIASYSDTIDSDGTVVAVLFAWTTAYIVAAHIAGATHFPQSTDAIRWIGVSVFAGLLYACTFSSLDELHFQHPLAEITWTTWFYFLVPIAVAVATIALLFSRFRATLADNIDFTEALIVVIVFALAVLSAFEPLKLNQVNWIIFSILFLSYSILLIYRGTQYLRWQSTALGSILLSAYTFARFMDLFDSLLMRGMAFLVIGALLFAIGLYYSKQKQKSISNAGGTYNARA